MSEAPRAVSRAFDVAIVGAGPAGSTLAHRLAAAGATVALFDPSHPREKVCAGGISARARAMFPELNQLADQARQGTTLRLIGPSGLTVEIARSGGTMAIDRTILDKTLLDWAVNAGAAWFPWQVTGFEKTADGYTIRTPHRPLKARLLVGADGVYSLVRKALVGPIPHEHLALGAHVLVKDLNPPCAVMRFFGDRRGYAWVFNRKERSSIGIGMPQTKKDGWPDWLARFYCSHAPGRAMPHVRGWSLPLASHREFFDRPTAGDDWLLVGDAAGHVDPLTGEGIWYAMWGARLAAEAILAGRPGSYHAAWQEAYRPRFEKHLRWAPRLEKARLVDALILAGRLPFIGRRLFGAISG
jgi:geranylgeranyl reductase family protein